MDKGDRIKMADMQYPTWSDYRCPKCKCVPNVMAHDVGKKIFCGFCGYEFIPDEETRIRKVQLGEIK